MWKLIIAILFSSSAMFAATAPDTEGFYSRLAVSVPSIAQSLHGLRSPNGESILHAVEDDRVDCCWPYKVWVSRKGKDYPLDFGTLAAAEVLWSPDSLAFFVTYTDGGAVGTYHVLVYRMDDKGVHKSEPVPNGRKLSKPDCMTREYPNVGGIQWGADSASLVLAVEVPPHSSCVDMGTFHAFEISVPGGKVLREYGQLEAKSLFAKTLGVELRNADDECITKPKSCDPWADLPPAKNKKQ